MSNQNEGEFLGVIVASGDLSLEERVAALEKQLADTQAAMSCELQNILLTMQANQQFGCDVEKSISELSHKKI
ncbi:hypothetical protein [Proteus mirabilis]|uniref:hypothetical protein n=1 Tax=Proteus mirabilis TaxID=584 RepID=UPI0034D70D61